MLGGYDNGSEAMPERGLRTLAAMQDERKEPCYGCGKIWYAIHHQDGLCYRCVREGKRGREENRRRLERIQFFALIVFGAIMVYAMWNMFHSP